MRAAGIYVSSFPPAAGLRKKYIARDATDVLRDPASSEAGGDSFAGHPKQRFARALAALRYGLALTAVHASPDE